MIYECALHYELLCIPYNRDKENVLYFGKSKPNCHCKLLLCFVVH